MSENFVVKTFMWAGSIGIAFFIKFPRYCPSIKQKYRAKTIKTKDTKKEPALLTKLVPITNNFEL